MVRSYLEDTSHWIFADVSRQKNKLVRDNYRASRSRWV